MTIYTVAVNDKLHYYIIPTHPDKYTGYRFFEDSRFPHGYFNTFGWYDAPDFGPIAKEIPDNLKYHIFTTIFNGDPYNFDRLLRS